MSEQIEGIEHTIQVASTSTELLIVGTVGASVPFTADWVSYTGHNDSTIVTSLTSQQYNEGVLYLELYFSQAAIEALNEELNEPETSPPAAVSDECLVTGIYFAGRLVEAAAASILWAKIPIPPAFGWMWFKRGQAVAAFYLHLCVCWEQCFATVPPAHTDWLRP